MPLRKSHSKRQEVKRSGMFPKLVARKRERWETTSRRETTRRRESDMR